VSTRCGVQSGPQAPEKMAWYCRCGGASEEAVVSLKESFPVAHAEKRCVVILVDGGYRCVVEPSEAFVKRRSLLEPSMRVGEQ